VKTGTVSHDIGGDLACVEHVLWVYTLYLIKNCRNFVDLKIDYLKNHTHLIPLLSTWHFESWGKEYGLTSTEQAAAWLEQELNDDTLPLCFVVFERGRPIAMCSLAFEDGLPLPDGPWFCSLYVEAEYRGKGLGEVLVQVIVEQAKKMGFRELFLLTFKEITRRWYERLGWKVHTSTEMNGFQGFVMKLTV
jgi:GNAT superfamily N-acetyltransferase